MKALIERDRISCGRQMADSAEELKGLIPSLRFQRLVERKVGEWRLVERIDPESAYNLVRDVGNNLYVVLGFALSKVNIPEPLRSQITFSMEEWLRKLTIDESIRLVGLLKQVCA